MQNYVESENRSRIMWKVEDVFVYFEVLKQINLSKFFKAGETNYQRKCNV